MLQINASVVKHYEKFWCCYQTKHLRHFNAECFLTELNPDLEPISEKKLLPENRNTAFENVKLFSFKDKLLAFYSYLPFEESIGWTLKYGVAYGELNPETGMINNQVSLRNVSKRADEKNWVPYSFNNELFMITDLDPFLRVVKIAENTEATEIYLATDKTKSWQFGELRCGTPLLSQPGDDTGWLYGFAHSYLTDDNGFRRNYYYTVVRFNHQTKQLEFYPEPLPYNNDEPDDEYEKLWKRSNGRYRKVIFPAGIMQHDDGVVVSFGLDDVLSYTEHFTWQRIKNYFI